MEQRVQKFLLILAAILVVLFGVQSCRNGANYDRVKIALRQMAMEKDSLEVQVQKDGSKIAEQSQMILTQKEAIETGLLEIDRLKNVKSQVRFLTKTVVDTFYAEVGEPIIIDSATNSVMRTFRYNEKDDWFSVSGDYTEDRLRINNLTYRDEYQLTIADKKLGFFKKPEPSVILKSKNPYTDIQSMQNIVITVQNPWYKRPWVWGLSGFATGYLIK